MQFCNRRKETEGQSCKNSTGMVGIEIRKTKKYGYERYCRDLVNIIDIIFVMLFVDISSVADCKL